MDPSPLHSPGLSQHARDLSPLAHEAGNSGCWRVPWDPLTAAILPLDELRWHCRHSDSLLWALKALERQVYWPFWWDRTLQKLEHPGGEYHLRRAKGSGYNEDRELDSWKE